MRKYLQVVALTTVIIAASSVSAAGFFWFITGYALGVGTGAGGGGMTSSTLGIPARCWITENKKDYADCRYPSLIEELGDKRGMESLCDFSNKRGVMAVSSPYGKSAHVDVMRACNPVFHIDLEWQVILNTKKAAAAAAQKSK